MQNPAQELFDIVDENDNLLGVTKPRDVVHKEMKDWHRATGIWIINEKKQILCQQRSLKKDVDPGKWQPFFGGHLNSGETYLQSAVKELNEELGLEVRPEELLFVYKVKNEHYKHFSELFVYAWNGNPSDLKFSDGEVQQVKWMDISQFEEMIHSLGDSTYKFDERMQIFISNLEISPGRR